MNLQELRFAAVLAEALRDLFNVSHCSRAHLEKEDIFLRISVYERDGEGGVTFADACLPLGMSGDLLRHIEERVRGLLSYYGIEVSPEEQNG